MEIVKKNYSGGLLWKRIKLIITHKVNAKKRLLRDFAEQDDIKEKEIGFCAFILYVIGNVLLENTHNKTDILLRWYNSGGISVDALIRQRCECIVDFVVASSLKEDVGISQPMGATLNHSSYPPMSQVGTVVTPEANWVILITCHNGEIFNFRVPPIDNDLVQHLPIDANLTLTEILLRWYKSGDIFFDALIRQMDVGISQPMGATLNHSSYPPMSQVGAVVTPEANWVIPITCRNGEIFNFRVPLINKDLVQHLPIDANLTLSCECTVDFVGASGIKEDVGISQPMGATFNHSSYPPMSQVGAVVTPEANWFIPITCRNGKIFNLHVPPINKDLVQHLPIDANLTLMQTEILLRWYNSGDIFVKALIRQRIKCTVDFVGTSGLKEDVGISQSMGATFNHSSYPPMLQVGAVVIPEANWVIPITYHNGEIFNFRVPPINKDLVQHLPIDANLTLAQLKTMLEDYMHATGSMASIIRKINSRLYLNKDDIMEFTLQELNSNNILYSEYTEVVETKMIPPQVQTRPAISREDVYVRHFAGFRAFMLYVIGNVLLANSHNKVHLGYLASLTQIDEIGSYDLGGIAYTHLIGCLDLVCRFGIGNGSKAVVEMWQVIEYWYYSYFRNGMHDQILEGPDQFPAINNCGPTYCHKVVGEDSTCIRINHPYVQKVLELTSRRCILFGPLLNVWYLEERCHRQVTGVPLVSCDPPSPRNLNGCRLIYCSDGATVAAFLLMP
ncbi:hypothetical protein IFM89_018740 [Coptis chinensis]|uniref:Uncharacterized protein n=1 Tax=Coptis chinensis TaxID=261450 RepID=A0A835LQM9_9MAGN|nr:hypothetical protein IFM89_018740 [Coptis chinensis]